ncbi:methyltransferase domain-containing protein [Nocardia sp. R6R-6]|uniref:methyltransferase domain-containing protein n=1 Tax=Nocardia sp. R6R-6 TaxID=3459303 RepID=UPI00403D9816
MKIRETAPAGPAELAELFLEHGVSVVIPHAPELSTLSLEQIARLPGLPYADPDFSRRLLRQQLDPGTTDSSRPRPLVARQLEWIRAQLRSDWRPRAVYHPFCGPGTYAAEWRSAGVRRYVGVDLGPAVMQHAEQRFRDDPDIAFLLGDASDPEFLPADYVFDTVLLSYDAMNFHPWRPTQAMVAPLAARLPEGGTLLLDLLVAEDGAAGFDDARQARFEPRGSVFHDGPHHLLSEGLVHRTGAALGHRFIALGPEPGRPQVFHSILWVPRLGEVRSLLESSGLTVIAAGRPFPATDDPNLNRHTVVARKLGQPTFAGRPR